MPHAIRIHETGGPEVLRWEAVEPGKPGPGEVLVSSTVKDLVAGSGLQFEDRGVHTLKGVPGEWRLFKTVSG